MIPRVLQTATRPRTVATVAALTAGLGLYTLNTRKPLSAESAAGTSKAPRAFSSGLNLVSLRLKTSESINHNVKHLRFEFADPNAVSGLPLTSALLTISRPEGRWLPVIRPYTPVSDMDEPGHIDFMVKQYPHGKASTHLHSMKPGDTLRFAGPIKGYSWTPNKDPHIGLLAGGSGITPMYQLIQGILKNPEDKTKITLVWSVNTDEDIFLMDQFKKLQSQRPDQFDVHYLVSRPIQGSPYPQGYITKDVLARTKITTRDGVNKVLVCGPPAMEASLTGAKSWLGSGKGGILAELGYTSAQIHKF